MKSILPVLTGCLICLTLVLTPDAQSRADEKKQTNRTRFYIASPEGKDPQVFFFAEDYYNTGSPAFSPDGRRLYFSSQRGPTGKGPFGLTYEISVA